MKREPNELVKRKYFAQKESPTKGNWIHIIKEDMELLDIDMSKTKITRMSKNQFKKLVKTSVKTATFRALRTLQDNHTKIKHINYNGFRLQPYLQSERLNSKEASTLFNMRADTVNGIKKCFPKLYENNMQCKLGCLDEDSIRHIYKCKQLGQASTTSIEAIYGNEFQQVEAVSEFIRRCSLRSALLADDASQGQHEQVLDTSTPAAARGARSSAGDS